MPQELKDRVVKYTSSKILDNILPEISKEGDAKLDT
jgi:hypothetical protein